MKEYNESGKLFDDAADAIEELQRQIDAWVEPERKALIKSLPKWIPVTERLPEDGKYVLAYSADDDFTTVDARHRFEERQRRKHDTQTEN